MYGKNNRKKRDRSILLLYVTGKLLHFMNMRHLLVLWATQADRGLYRTLINAFFIGATLDLGEATMRYYHSYTTNIQSKQGFFYFILKSSTYWYLLLFALFLSIHFLVSPNIPSAQEELNSYLGVIFFSGYAVLINATLKVWNALEKKVIWPNILQHIGVELMIMGVITGYHAGYWEVQGLVYGTAGVYLVCAIAMCLYMLWAKTWPKAPGIPPLKTLAPGFSKHFIRYNFFVILPSRVVLILKRILPWLLCKWAGKEATSSYTDLAIIVVFLEIPMKIAKQTVGPYLSHLLQKNQQEKVHKLYTQNTLYQATLSSFFLIFFSYLLPYILGKHFTEEVFYLFLVLSLGKALYNLFTPAQYVLFLSKHFAWGIWNVLLLISALFLSYPLILWHPIFGAAWLVTLFTLVNGLFLSFVVWKQMGITPWSKGLFCLLLSTLCCLFLLRCYPPSSNSPLYTTLFCSLTCLYYAFFWIVFGEKEKK